MTWKTWHEALADIDWSGFPIPMRWVLTEQPNVWFAKDVDAWQLQLYIKVPDRSTREMIEVVNVTALPPFKSVGDDAARYIRQLALSLVGHEFDEHYLVRGERVFDPHKNDRWDQLKRQLPPDELVVK